MHFRQDDDDSDKNVTPEPKIGQTIVWPFLIQGAMEQPACTSTTKETVPILLWTTIAVFGIVYTLLGYRCLRAVGFLTGLAAGSGCIIWLQIQQITLLGSQTAPALAVVSGLFGAVLGSAHPIASALIGAFAGGLLAGASMVVCIATIPDRHFGETEVLVAIGGGAVICTILTVCFAKILTILASSIVGSAMILCSIDFFMHELKTIDWLLNMQLNPQPPPCWGGILICSWPVLAMVGLLVQCFITAWRIDHRRQKHRRRRVHRSRSSSRTRETREEARQRKYRYLYQVRTAHGDIISQNFVSALQKRIQPGNGPPSEHSIKTGSNERNTLRSDRTHMTNLPGDSDIDRMDFGVQHEERG